MHFGIHTDHRARHNVVRPAYASCRYDHPNGRFLQATLSQQGDYLTQLSFANGTIFIIDPVAKECERYQIGAPMLPPEWPSYIPFKETARVDNITSDIYEFSRPIGPDNYTVSIIYAVSKEKKDTPVRWWTIISDGKETAGEQQEFMTFQPNAQAEPSAYQAPDYCPSQPAKPDNKDLNSGHAQRGALHLASEALSSHIMGSGSLGRPARAEA